MQCPKCGAESRGRFCEYCGCEIPKNGPDTVNYNNSSSNTTVVNNYYQTPSAQANYNGAMQRPNYNQPMYNQPNYNQPMYNQPVYNRPIYTQMISPKSKTVALILCILLGYFGIHHFYAGRVGMGLLYLFTFGLFGIGWLVDILLIALGAFKDSLGLPIKK